MDSNQPFIGISSLRPGLLRLPLELSTMIYEYCLPEVVYVTRIREPGFEVYSISTTENLTLAILGVNKRIRQDASKTFWKRVVFAPTPLDQHNSTEFPSPLTRLGLAFTVDRKRVEKVRLSVKDSTINDLEHYPKLTTITFVPCDTHDLLEHAWLVRKQANECACLDCSLAWSARALPLYQPSSHLLIVDMDNLIKKYQVSLVVQERTYRFGFADFTGTGDICIQHTWEFNYNTNTYTAPYSFLKWCWTDCPFEWTFPPSRRSRTYSHISISLLRRLMRDENIEDVRWYSRIANCPIQTMLALAKAIKLPGEKLTAEPCQMIHMCRKLKQKQAQGGSGQIGHKD